MAADDFDTVPPGKKKVHPSEKFEKGGAKDISKGPVPDRRCTDCPCLLLFLAHAGVFWYLISVSFGIGSPTRLYAPRDFRGDFCGLEVAGSAQLLDFPSLAFSLNLGATVDDLVQTALCQAAAGELSASERAAACTPPNDGFPLQNVSDAAGALAQLSSPAGALQLLQSAGASGTSLGSTMLSTVTRYINFVCTDSCLVNASAASRVYRYQPPPNAPWLPLWQRYAAALPVLAELAFPAWPLQHCPYDARYCVPFPGLEFTEGFGGYCLPAVSGPMMDAATGGGSALKGALASGLGELQAAAGATNLGDVLRTWDVAIMVILEAAVIGFIFLVCLRFFAKIVVWTSLISIVALLALAALAMVTRSFQCDEEAFLDPSGALSMLQEAQSVAVNGTLVDRCTALGGYAVKEQLSRQVLGVAGLVVAALALLAALALCCLRSRIELAVAVSRVAAQFVAHTPEVLLVPVIQLIVGTFWVSFWVIAASYLLSAVPVDAVPSGWYATELEAAGDASAAGACNAQWPSGFAWQAQVDCGNTTAGAEACWRCAPPRVSFDAQFGYAFFSLLWHNALLVALGQCIIAGAVGVWFFAPRAEKARAFKVWVSCKRACYHLGSLAFGAFILALVQFVRWFLYYLSKQSKAQKNAVAEKIFACLSCLLLCFERCIKFLNKNAYIQVALQGSSFCTAAKEAFCLITRNFVRFGVLVLLGAVTHRIGLCFVVVLSTIVGYLTLEALYPEVSPMLPVLCYFVVSYLIARLLLTVFSLAVDTTFYAFIVTEEMKYRGDFVPDNLKAFIKQRDLEPEPEPRGCGRCCCCG